MVEKISLNCQGPKSVTLKKILLQFYYTKHFKLPRKFTLFTSKNFAIVIKLSKNLLDALCSIL